MPRQPCVPHTEPRQGCPPWCSRKWDTPTVSSPEPTPAARWDCRLAERWTRSHPPHARNAVGFGHPPHAWNAVGSGHPPHAHNAVGFGHTDLAHAALTTAWSAGSFPLPSNQPCASTWPVWHASNLQKEQHGSELLGSPRLQRQRLNGMNGRRVQSHQAELEIQQQNNSSIRQCAHERKSGAFSHLPRGMFASLGCLLFLEGKGTPQSISCTLKPYLSAQRGRTSCTPHPCKQSSSLSNSHRPIGPRSFWVSFNRHVSQRTSSWHAEIRTALVASPEPPALHKLRCERYGSLAAAH